MSSQKQPEKLAQEKPVVEQIFEQLKTGGFAVLGEHTLSVIRGWVLWASRDAYDRGLAAGELLERRRWRRRQKRQG